MNSNPKHLHLYKTISYKAKATFITHITQPDIHRNEAARTSKYITQCPQTVVQKQ